VVTAFKLADKRHGATGDDDVSGSFALALGFVLSHAPKLATICQAFVLGVDRYKTVSPGVLCAKVIKKRYLLQVLDWAWAAIGCVTIDVEWEAFEVHAAVASLYSWIFCLKVVFNSAQES
jgi:hypothetical protein